MSMLRLLIIKGNTLYSAELHFRQAIQFLNASTQTQERYLRLMRQKRYLDAGYVLIDCDREIMINNQSAFSLTDLSKKKRDLFMQQWRVFE